MKYSIIIISYNEAKAITETIKRVMEVFLNTSHEIIVVDGGSDDKTLELISSYELKVIHSKLGRGLQFREGIRNSCGETLILLHADTLMPINTVELINDYFHAKQLNISTFRLTFDKQNPLYNLYSFFTRFDSIFSTFGDQCIIIKKDFYDKIGGLPEWEIFEDVKLLQNARKFTKIKKLPGFVITSSRRFNKNGIIRQQLRNFYYILLYLLGTDHHELKRRYDRSRFQTNDNEAVIIMAKYPVKGSVKTRLAKKIGDNVAVSIYKHFAKYTFDLISKMKKSIFLFYSGDVNSNEVKDWVNHNFHFMRQVEGNLGVKISNAFELVFKKNFNKCLVIGTDLPELNSNLIELAFRKLTSFDVVIGPSNDGGYYLLGLNKNHQELFKDVNWSTETVFVETIDRCKINNLSVYLLPNMNDIDEESDLLKWLKTGENRDLISKVDFIINQNLNEVKTND